MRAQVVPRLLFMITFGLMLTDFRNKRLSFVTKQTTGIGNCCIRNETGTTPISFPS